MIHSIHRMTIYLLIGSPKIKEVCYEGRVNADGHCLGKQRKKYGKSEKAYVTGSKTKC